MKDSAHVWVEFIASINYGCDQGHLFLSIDVVTDARIDDPLSAIGLSRVNCEHWLSQEPWNSANTLDVAVIDATLFFNIWNEAMKRVLI